jgi:membrane-associated phospholipid phosphatase
MDTLMQIEIQINLFFQGLGVWLTGPFQAITFLGNETFYLLIMPAFYWCIDATLGFRMGVMLVFTNSINGYLKVLFHSPRPYWIDSRVKAFISETSFGLPSGHAQNAASIWGILAASLKRTWLTIVCVVIVILIGLSRIYLGVHFTRDVLAGWLIGILLIVTYMLIERPVSNWISNKPLTLKIAASFIVSIIIIGVGILLNVRAQNWPFPTEWMNQSFAASEVFPDPYNLEGLFTISGVWFGFTSGYAWLLKRKGKILISGSTGKRLVRYSIGLVGVLILYLGLKMVFPESPEWLGLSLRFVRYSLIGLWVSAFAPIVFEKLHLDA